MTFSAHRYNIKFILLGIAIVVMVFLRLFPTATFKSGRMSKPTYLDSITYGSTSFAFVDVFKIILPETVLERFTLAVFAFILYNLFCLSVFTHVFTMKLFSFVSLSILSITNIMTQPAIWGISIWLRLVFVKLANWFDFLARATSFRYNCFRHDRLLLISDYCLEPLQTRCLCGLIYYDRVLLKVKEKT